MNELISEVKIMYGLSQAVQHVKSFTLSMFPDGFFKSVYFVDEDFRTRMKNKRIRLEKPALAFRFEPKPEEAFFDNPYQFSGFQYQGHSFNKLFDPESTMNNIVSDEINDIYVWEGDRRFRFEIPVTIRMNNRLTSIDVLNSINGRFMAERYYRMTENYFYVAIPPVIINRIAKKLNIDNAMDFQMWIDDISRNPIQIVRNPADGVNYFMFKIIRKIIVKRGKAEWKEEKKDKLFKHADINFTILCDFSYPAMYAANLSDIVDEELLSLNYDQTSSVRYLIPLQGIIPGYLNNGMRLISTSRFFIEPVSGLNNIKTKEELLKGQIIFSLDELQASDIELQFRSAKEKLYGEISERRFVTLPGTSYQIPVGWKITEEDMDYFEAGNSITMHENKETLYDGWSVFTVSSELKRRLSLYTESFFDSFKENTLYRITCVVRMDSPHSLYSGEKESQEKCGIQLGDPYNTVEIVLNNESHVMTPTQPGKFQTITFYMMNSSVSMKDSLKLVINFMDPTSTISIAKISIKEFQGVESNYATISRDRNLYFGNMLTEEQKDVIDFIIDANLNPYTAFYFIITNGKKTLSVDEYDVDWKRRMISMKLLDTDISDEYHIGVYGDYDRIKRLSNGIGGSAIEKAGSIETDY